uniref:Cadherin domain-containing protein n=1 Tax=Macrostomum lignano TaxID=282301 RepID=A0A1I8IWM4_9PLAT
SFHTSTASQPCGTAPFPPAVAGSRGGKMNRAQKKKKSLRADGSNKSAWSTGGPTSAECGQSPPWLGPRGGQSVPRTGESSVGRRAQLPAIVLVQPGGGGGWWPNFQNKNFAERAAERKKAEQKGRNRRIRYSIEPRTAESSCFRLDPSAGLLSLEFQKLDREANPLHRIVIVARDCGEPPLSASVTATLSLMDVNDNPPEFEQPSPTVNLSEAVPVGHVITRLRATSRDSGRNAEIRYRLLDSAGLFNLSELTDFSIIAQLPASFSVSCAALLGRSSKCSSTFASEPRNCHFSAAEPGKAISGILPPDPRPPLTNLNGRIHILDMPSTVFDPPDPWWAAELSAAKQQQQSREKPFPQGTPAAQAEAGNGDRVPDPGHIFHTEAAEIVAKGAGMKSSSTSVEFLRFQFEAPLGSRLFVSERAAPLTAGESAGDERSRCSQSVFWPEREMLAREGRAGEVAGSPRQTGSEQRRHGREAERAKRPSELVLAAPLDFERQQRHHATVRAFDLGDSPLSSTAVVTVRVLDENDNAPQFLSDVYNASLPENREPGYRLDVNLTATDADSGDNGRLAYSIESGNSQQLFSLDMSTGRLFARKKADREAKDFYRLTVLATDYGNPPMTGRAEVRIRVLDENDCEPKFDQEEYRFVMQIDDKGNVSQQPYL